MTAADDQTSQHNQREGRGQNMDSVEPNGCGKRPPAEVCAGTTGWRHHAALFIELYDKKEARLRDLQAEIQEIGTQVRKWNTKSKWSFYTGLVSAAVAVAAGLTVPFTGAVGFAVTAALTSVAAGGAVFGFKIKQFRTEEESLKRIKQFLKIVNRLEHELDELMQRRLEKAEPPNVSALTNRLVKLFQSMDGFRAADGVSELTAQCHVVFQELGDVRKQLEESRGSSEAQTELVHESEVRESKGRRATENEAETESSSLLRCDRRVEKAED